MFQKLYFVWQLSGMDSLRNFFQCTERLLFISLPYFNWTLSAVYSSCLLFNGNVKLTPHFFSTWLTRYGCKISSLTVINIYITLKEEKGFIRWGFQKTTLHTTSGSWTLCSLEYVHWKPRQFVIMNIKKWQIQLTTCYKYYAQINW